MFNRNLASGGYLAHSAKRAAETGPLPSGQRPHAQPAWIISYLPMTRTGTRRKVIRPGSRNAKRTVMINSPLFPDLGHTMSTGSIVSFQARQHWRTPSDLMKRGG